MSAAALQLLFQKLEAKLPLEFLTFIKNYATSDIIPRCSMCGFRSFDPQIIYDVRVLMPDFHREGEWEEPSFRMCITCSDISEDFYDHEYISTFQMFYAIQYKREKYPNYIGRYRLPQEEIPLDSIDINEGGANGDINEGADSTDTDDYHS